MKKLTAVLIAVLIMLNSVFAFAKEQTKEEEQTNVLTVEEAVKKAIDFSRTIKKNSESIDVADDGLPTTINQLNAASDSSEIINLNVKLKETYKNIESYTAGNEIEKEKIKLNVTEIFADIIKAEKELELYKKELEIKEKELNITKVKAEIGKISESEYTSALLTYDKALSTLSDKKTAIEKAYTELNKILGIDDSEKYSVSLDINYESLGDYDLDYDIQCAISTNQNITDIQKSMEITKYQLDTYTSNTSKKQKEVSYAQSTRELTDAKNELKISITNQYNTIISTEKNYESNLKELEQLEKELEIIKVKFDIGSVTETELLKKEYDVLSLQAETEHIVYEHYIQVCKLKNSNLL